MQRTSSAEGVKEVPLPAIDSVEMLTWQARFY